MWYQRPSVAAAQKQKTDTLTDKRANTGGITERQTHGQINWKTWEDERKHRHTDRQTKRHGRKKRKTNIWTDKPTDTVGRKGCYKGR